MWRQATNFAKCVCDDSLSNRDTVLLSSGCQRSIAGSSSYFPAHAQTGLELFKSFLVETACFSAHNTAISIDPRASGSLADYVHSNTELRQTLAAVCPSFQLVDVSTTRGKFHAHGTGRCSVALDTRELRKLGFFRHVSGWKHISSDGGEIFIKRITALSGWVDYVTSVENLRTFQRLKTFEELQKLLHARAVLYRGTAGAVAIKTYSISQLELLRIDAPAAGITECKPKSLLLNIGLKETEVKTGTVRSNNTNARPKTNARVVVIPVNRITTKGGVPVFVEFKPGSL